MTDLENIKDIRLRSKDWFISGFISSDTNVSKVMQLQPIVKNKELKELKFEKSSDKPDRINGIYKDLKFSNIREFGEFIKNSATPNDVFVSGVAGYDEVFCFNPTNKHKAEIEGKLPEKYIMRNQHHIHWADLPGLLMIDIDEYKGGYVSQKEALALVYNAIPELKDAPTLIKPSTSSCIKYTGTSKLVDRFGKIIDPDNVTGKSGIRMYFVISSLKWLFKAKEFMKVRFWNSGTGYMDYTANGSEYPKCLIDLSVYNNSSRADFIKAGFEAKYGYTSENLEQNFGEFTYINENNPPLDVGIFLDHISKEEFSDYNELLDKERRNLANKARQKAISESHEESRVSQGIKDKVTSLGRELKESEKQEISHNIKKSIRKMKQSGFIDMFQPIYVVDKQQDGSVRKISIKDIYEEGLSWKNKYNGMNCASVIDPYYFPGKIYNGINSDKIDDFNSVEIDFKRARIWCDEDDFYIVDQAHGGTKLFFDTEWLDIKKLKLKRLDIDDIEIPKYNLTKIANCFINQYLVASKEDINTFGNVLKNLNHPHVKEMFCIIVNSNNAEKIWDKLDGIGPSLFEFMNRNKNSKEDVDLSNNKLLDINKLDIKYKCHLLRQTYAKIMYSTQCLYAKKRYNFQDGWSYDFIEDTQLKKFLRAHKVYKYYPNAKEKTRMIRLFDFWDDVELVSYSEIEFFPVKGVVACKQDVIKASKTNSFNTYCGLNVVPERSQYEASILTYLKKDKKDEDGNLVYEEKLDDEGIVVRDKDEKIQYTDKKIEIRVPDKKIIQQVSGDYLLKEHIYEIMCGGDSEKYEYLLNWYARMLQKPNEQGGSVIAFQGAQGAGKNTLSDVLCKILGNGALDIANGNLIFGNFNFVLADKVYVNFNEAIFSGDRKGQAQFKTITTESHIVINRKNKDEMKIKNTLHLSLISNHEALAPMDAGDRRIAMFDALDTKVGKQEYFTELYDEIKNGGTEHFAYELLNRDISGFRPSALPKNSSSNAALNSILNFGELWQQWWYECLADNELYGGVIKIGSENDNRLSSLMKLSSGGLEKSGIPTLVLYEAYLSWREKSGQNRGGISQRKLTEVMQNISSGKKVIKWGEEKVKGAKNCIILGGLDRARKTYEGHLKRKVDWN